jgi:D-3-phosphoglycerate dehydrogenase / 2-oxoglutarate reductase
MADTKYQVLLPATIASAAWDLIRQRSDIVATPFDMGIPTAQFHSLLANADAVGLSLTPFGDAELDAGRKVRVVARHGVGYDNVDVPALTRRGVPLMVTGIANSPTVAEHALFFMLTHAKRGVPLDTIVRGLRWAERFKEATPADLFGKTVLIVGFGRIGSRLARACLALGMNVRVYDPYVRAAVVEAAGCGYDVDLDAAVGHADFISIHCPRSSETENMFDAARIARMKPTACLVNTARGGIIDEAALARSLNEGIIAGAGIDVFDREPITADNPLLRARNITLAPHMAGVTRESLDRMGITVVKNILGVLDGSLDRDNVINKEIFTRQDPTQTQSRSA